MLAIVTVFGEYSDFVYGKVTYFLLKVLHKGHENQSQQKQPKRGSSRPFWRSRRAADERSGDIFARRVVILVCVDERVARRGREAPLYVVKVFAVFVARAL